MRLYLALLLLPTLAWGQLTRLDDDFKLVENVCRGKDCTLTNVFFHHQPFSLKDPSEKYPLVGSIFHAGMEAKTWQDLQEYGFVQYIRGCTFESRVGSSGKIRRRIGEVIRHFGKRQTFVFPNWTFDATSTDPLYYGPSKEDSELAGGRLALYEWHPVRGRYESNRVQYHNVLKRSEAQRRRMTPRLVVKDTPSPATYRPSSKAFNNVALEFKMCVYRLKDIPLVVDHETVLHEAIVCHEWESQFEFDFDRDRYVYSAKKGQHEFCASQVPLNPAQAFQRELEQGEED